MNIQRIYAVIYRHFLPTFRDAMRISDAFYWPLVDVTMFGFVALWTQEKMVDSPHFSIALLTSVACWFLVQRSGLEIGRNILIEIWEGNLTNLFATPLTLLEIMIALMSLGLIQAIITFFYTLVIILLFYGYNIFLFIPSLLPFMILFILFGWTIGLLITSIIFIYGKTVDTLAWGALWFFAIIGGAFYPIKLYPWWLARFAYFFPHTYLFEGVRAMIMNQTSPVYYLSMGFILGIIYFKCSYMILVWAFNKSKKNGLSQLIS